MPENLPPLSYGRQWIDDDDLRAVADCLRGDWLTQGPAVERFEKALCGTTGARFAVAVSSGTAALHLAVLALGVKPGDLGLVPAITFVASANAIAYAGGRVKFVDVDPETALVDLKSLERMAAAEAAGGRPPKIIVPVDMAGQPADLPAVRRIAARYGAAVVEDAAHALGAVYRHEGGRSRAGSCDHSDASILSFHPVKHITTGEGGAVLTNDEGLAGRLRELRSHGIHRDPARFERRDQGPWYHEQVSLGFNYRITDLQCALGVSQLSKLGRFVAKRRELSALYDRALGAEAFSGVLSPLRSLPGNEHAYHLYVVRVLPKHGESNDQLALRRRDLDARLRAKNILPQVHYIPVNWQPYYRHAHGSAVEDAPGAALYYSGCLSLPLHPQLGEADVRRVTEVLAEWAGAADVTVAIVNYGMGNLRSVLNAFESLGAGVRIAADPAGLADASHVVLPGVGAFPDAMRNLRSGGWIPALEKEVRERGKPFLGLCLGMQLLATEGTEFERCDGLGWIKGTVVRLEGREPDVRIPHIGWNDARFTLKEGLFSGLGEAQPFYFVHSYAFRPEDAASVAATCVHGTEFVAAVEQGNLHATQFHPEKSQKAGLAVLRNFLKAGA